MSELRKTWRILVYGRTPQRHVEKSEPMPNLADPVDWRRKQFIQRKYWHRIHPPITFAVSANVKRREEKEIGVAPTERGDIHLFADKNRYNT